MAAPRPRTICRPSSIRVIDGLQDVDLLGGAGGGQEAVTTGNRSVYLRLLCHHLLTATIEQQTAAVLRGLLSIIPEPMLMVTAGCYDDDAACSRVPVQAMQQCLNAKELDVLLGGEPNVDVDNWQQHTLYDSFSRESPQVVWFWELVREWEPHQLSRFLVFVTGPASHHVRAGCNAVVVLPRIGVCWGGRVRASARLPRPRAQVHHSARR